MKFAIDTTALVILALALLAAGLLKMVFFSTKREPSLAFSRLDPLPLSWRARLSNLPSKMQQAALLCLLLAFADPHFLLPRTPTSQNQSPTEIPTKGIAIYLLLDQSGSMNEEVKARGADGRLQKISKINLLKQVTSRFIQDHPSDLIGMLAFARIPRILVPLTLDQGDLLTQLNKLEVVSDPNDDGTAMGYAIFKAANLIAATRHFAEELPADAKPAYEIKNSIIIVVTDGLQDPNRLDYGNRLRTIELDDAAAYAKSEKIKVYIVNVDPGISAAEFAPQRKQMQTITELTGGKLFLVNEDQGLQNVYHTIDQLEKENIPVAVIPQDDKSAYQRFDLFPYLLFLSLLILLMGIGIDSLFIRTVP